MVVTLLSNKEFPDKIVKECNAVGIKNFHIEINGANAALLSDNKTIKIIKEKLQDLFKLLNSPVPPDSVTFDG
jgi:glycerol dehydrogenase-like iron-containing ADH family enzyme